MLASYKCRHGSSSQSTSVLEKSNTTLVEQFKSYLLETIYPAHENCCYSGFDHEYAEAVVRAAAAERTPINDLFYLKRRRFVYLRWKKDEILASAIATPKRGGAVYLGPILLSGDIDEGSKILQDAVSRLQLLGRRKVYAIVPELDTQLKDVLLAHHFTREGLLHEPYHPGINMELFGKILQEVQDDSQSFTNHPQNHG